ncbi:MAG: DNA-packaging protein [Alphaproteobacteria bacterium]|nr:DNA-packaging protein [Alphaproteobacteria bacterium]
MKKNTTNQLNSEKESVLYPKWEQIARPNQLIPQGNWNIWMILAGRGFGKTRSAAEAIKKWATNGEYKRIALISNTIQEARQVMVEGESGLISISHNINEQPKFLPSRRLLIWPNGAQATLYGAENYEQLRGPQFDAAWIDEFAKFKYPKETFEQLSFSLRLSTQPKLILTTTPRPIPFIKALMKRKDVVTVRGSSLENLNNLSPTFLKQLEYLKGTRLEAQEIYAEILENKQNTLWSWDDIGMCYKTPPHFLNNIIIGVDPAITASDTSDETGIIVAGMDSFGKAYVLDDLSLSALPNIWAKKVVDAYHKYNAKLVVIERNAGGNLLNNLIESIDNSIKIKSVYAHQSKITRAEPIALLYQKKMIFHARQFHKLEMQMATYEPGNKSPDRLDAMVWSMHELFYKISDIIPTIWSI